MSNFAIQQTSPQKRSILQWFIICFLCFSIIFLIALLPLISYCKNIFTELTIEKSTQQMDSGISELENTVTSFVSASQSLARDTRFRPFRYLEPDYSEITPSVRKQMVEYLHGLMFPLELVSDCALLFSDNLVITPEATLFYSTLPYYPDRFRANNLSYTDWELLLEENASCFTPVCHVTTIDKSYDALIYSTRWTRTSYFYACLSITDIKQELISKENLGNYCLTIERTDGKLLYSDLTDTVSEYHSITKKSSIGGLTVTVHIPKTSLAAHMTPLYCFLALYLTLCIVVFIITIIVGSHISSRPLIKIIDLLESDNACTDDGSKYKHKARRPSLLYGFHYIHSKVQTYENNLNTCRGTIDSQSKILRARFLENALQGALVTDKDYALFSSYFPQFPASFSLLQVGLIEQPSEGENLYEDALSLMQYYLQTNLPNAYHQRLNNMELLLIIDENDYKEYSCIVNLLIKNINSEEPCYHAWGIASKFYSHPKDIPTAYWQMQDLYSRISLESLSQLCSVSDYTFSPKSYFQMSDIPTIYSAIICGNKDIALLKLESYSHNLSARNRSCYEMFRSILLCIKQEYTEVLMDIEIPSYHSDLDLYTTLKDIICSFCNAFNQMKIQTQTNHFAQELKTYIDLHFTDEDLCMTTLTEHFDCSVSTIRRAFSQVTDIAVSAYIEKKRMELANDLLVHEAGSISEIARKCGFTNDNTFYKAYRRVFGHAPTSLKQK